MIVAIKKEKEAPKYGRYFLYEAPPEDTEPMVADGGDEPPAPKPNTKIITIKPRKSRLNFADGAEIEDDTNDNNDNMSDMPTGDATGNPPMEGDGGMPASNGEDIPVDPNGEDPNGGVPMDNQQNIVDPNGGIDPNRPDITPLPTADVNLSTDPSVQEIDPNNPAPIDLGNGQPPEDYSMGYDQDNYDEPATDPNMGQLMDPNGGMPPAEGAPVDPNGGDMNTDIDPNAGEDMADPNGGAAPMDAGTGDSPDIGDAGGDDFTAGSDEDNPEADTGTPTDVAGTEKKGPGLEYDSTRKFVLFRKFLDLIDAMDNYSERLEASMNDDYEMNKVLKSVIDKIRDIREVSYDYLTMKFEINTYIQSLLFYQNQVIMIQMAFNVLERGKKLLKNKESKK